MTKLAEGMIFPEITYQTPFEEGVSLKDTVKKVNGKTAIVFLRYYGCTLCQYDMHVYAKEYQKVKDADGQMLVVLQSDPKLIREQIEEDTFPFDIICDPEEKLYHDFEIWPAESKEKLADLKVVAKIAKATASGFKHGTYEGDELQLPAVFVVNEDLKISYAHYAKSLGDMPDVDELVKYLK